MTETVKHPDRVEASAWLSDERLSEIVARYFDSREPFAEEVGLIALELQTLRSQQAPAGVVKDDEEEIYQIGKRDGYGEAVQDIDLLTGGDGEYRYCTDHDPERHTPDAEAMKARIVERFESLTSPLDAGGGAYEDLASRQSQTDPDIVAATIKNRSRLYADIAIPSPSPKGEESDYLVWSNEHRAWWRVNSQGYARSILEAGRYTRAEAVDIADKSRNGWKLDQRPDEIAVAIADLPPPIRAALAVHREGE